MNHKIITLARQFGSGGHEIGERLSTKLDIPLYDRYLVEMAAEQMGISPISVEEVDEAALHSFLSTYRVTRQPDDTAGYGLPLNDSTYLTQTALIQALAKKGPCIIVGRCANYILRDHPALIDVFLCADAEDRTARIMKRYDLPRKAAASAVRHTDSRRRNYYENYTKQSWGSIESHQLLLNVSKLGMERTVELICGLYDSELFDK